MPRLEVLESPPEAGEQRPHPLLFVHGAWHGAWCWQPHFMPYFSARGYHCHALSLRGHGQSDGAERLRSTRLREFMSDIRRVGEQLGKPVVIAHSMGALALRMLLEEWQPAAAILLCPYMREANSRWLKDLLPKHIGRVFAALMTANPYLLVCNPTIAKRLFFSSDMSEEDAKRWSAQLQNESFYTFMEMLRGLSTHPERVSTPMLVVSAEHDALFAPESHEALARRYHADFRFLPDLAHDAMLDTRWEDAARCLYEWLDSRGL